MSDIYSKIINTIYDNRISSTEVADALNKTGVLQGISPFIQKKFAVGEVFYAYAHSESNFDLHKQLEKVPFNSIIFIDTFNCNKRAVFGDIVSKYLSLYKRASAIVINGFVRDAHSIRKENYPLWAKGATPLGCFNKKTETNNNLKIEIEKRKAIFEESIMVCDDSGCTFISKEKINEETLKRLEFIELQEDIWYYCVDTLKWSTYETICEKKYLKTPEVLPEILRDALKKYNL